MRSNATAIVGTPDASKSYRDTPELEIAKQQVTIASANSVSVIGDDPMNPWVVMGVKPIFQISSEMA
jgi:hypothetical protein